MVPPWSIMIFAMRDASYSRNRLSSSSKNCSHGISFPPFLCWLYVKFALLHRPIMRGGVPTPRGSSGHLLARDAPCCPAEAEQGCLMFLPTVLCPSNTSGSLAADRPSPRTTSRKLPSHSLHSIPKRRACRNAQGHRRQ